MKSVLTILSLAFLFASCSNNDTTAANTATPSSSTAAPIPLTQPMNNTSSASNSTAVTPDNKATVKPTYIPDIVSLDKIDADENFNHLLKITISNPYDKPISTVQLYVNPTGNVWIPDDISEDDPKLFNLKVDDLGPKAQGAFTISTKDRGEDNPYAVTVRRIRFSDGSTLTPQK